MSESELLQRQRHILRAFHMAAAQRSKSEAFADAEQETEQEAVFSSLDQVHQVEDARCADVTRVARARLQSEQQAADAALEQAKQIANEHIATIHQASEQGQAILSTVGLMSFYHQADVRTPDVRPGDDPAGKLARNVTRTGELVAAILDLANRLRIERETARKRRRDLEIAGAIAVVAVLLLIMIALSASADRREELQTQATVSAIAPWWTQLEERTGMKMVYVPAGDFIMGSPDLALFNGQSNRVVYLDTYFIDRTEVSVGQYRLCVEASACSVPATGDGCTYASSAKSDHPVNCVDWAQAAVYCEWADKRLPTDAEWEKAARGVDGRTFPWGENKPTCRLGQFADCDGATAPVGSKPRGASPYGALDIAGNVLEWTADWYSPGNSNANDSRQSQQEPPVGSYSNVRGGSPPTFGLNVRPAIRIAYQADVRLTDLGFRCARSP